MAARDVARCTAEAVKLVDDLDDLLQLARSKLIHDLPGLPVLGEEVESRCDGFRHALFGGPLVQVRLSAIPKELPIAAAYPGGGLRASAGQATPHMPTAESADAASALFWLGSAHDCRWLQSAPADSPRALRGAQPRPSPRDQGIGLKSLTSLDM